MNDDIAMENLFQDLKQNPAPAVHPLMAAPLYGDRQPAYERQREKPMHRAILELSAQGYKAVEIAEQLGTTAVTVQDILLQPSLQKDLLRGIHENFGPDQRVVEVIKENVVNAINTQVEIMKDKEAKRADRLAAARDILERRYGKATQPIAAGTVVDLNNLPDAELVKTMQSN